ncbi:hypothetical protein CALVIDRAFT_345262 [Calocera viscosa TUFC12733]|uniref:Uncharacterized protein n=1 Tax=Calocera viscosa (strain TUFC12733) TaxID=1330018 RepID=A0A167HAE8_CALVF|nr:hypothetical protein CALVIDRAFT_345262 [Calocera viscosa TUFC12733]
MSSLAKLLHDKVPIVDIEAIKLWFLCMDVQTVGHVVTLAHPIQQDAAAAFDAIMEFACDHGVGMCLLCRLTLSALHWKYPDLGGIDILDWDHDSQTFKKPWLFDETELREYLEHCRGLPKDENFKSEAKAKKRQLRGSKSRAGGASATSEVNPGEKGNTILVEEDMGAAKEKEGPVAGESSMGTIPVPQSEGDISLDEREVLNKLKKMELRGSRRRKAKE